jgi:chitinase
MGALDRKDVILSFIVALAWEPCTPSWGAATSLAEAAKSLGLDRRVAQYRSQGGEPIVSFGGAANSELAHTCTDVERLTAAYEDVIRRYAQTTVDFDVEAASLADTTASQRRATALAAAQRSAAADGRPFSVWLTLPVTTSGLQSDALSVVTTTLAAGVDLAGVNVMTMNYGTKQHDMADAVRSSLTSTHDQLRRVYSKYGVAKDAVGTWNAMGATVMIGQNDTDGEIYTTQDATTLVTEAGGWGLGRVSMWSLNRDAQCGGSYAVVGVHSDTCSGTPQPALGFSQIFSKLGGTLPAVTVDATPTAVVSPTVVPDDPSTSPYPLWQPNRPYESGYKVVRAGDVYQAKWYTRGQDPAAQATDPSQNPWQLIGPVLPGESPAPLPTLAPGTHPAWSPHATYEAGDRVLYKRLPYEAKWYNTATSPGAYDADPSASPWKPLYTVPGEPTTSAG